MTAFLLITIFENYVLFTFNIIQTSHLALTIVTAHPDGEDASWSRMVTRDEIERVWMKSEYFDIVLSSPSEHRM